MKREQAYTFLQATLLAWGASLGGLGMMVTGLDLNVSMLPLAVLSLMVALGLGILLYQPKGIWIALGVETAVWLLPGLRLELKALGRSVVRYMTMAYGLECPQWLKGDRPDTLLPLLLVLGSLIMLPWLYSVLKGKTAAPAIGVWLVPLFFCITVTDTVPAVPWLFLWLLALLMLLLTCVTRRYSSAQGNRLLVLLLLPSILALGLLFRFIPEEKANDWEVMEFMDRIYDTFAPDTQWKNSEGGGEGNEEAGPNAEERVNLGSLKERNPTDRKIMDVTAEQPGLLYLRSRDYDQYTGLAWESTEGRLEMLTVSTAVQQNGGAVTIETEYGRDYFFLPGYLLQSMTIQNGKAPNVKRDKNYTFYRCKLPKEWPVIVEATMADFEPGMVYIEGTDSCTAMDITLEYQQQCMGNFDRYCETYLQLPEETRALATNYLTVSGFQFRDTLPNRAAFIQALVQSSATYDLQTGRMPDDRDDLAMWFLNESDTGYCVHFATAAAVLLRAAGIPARYVEGYMVEAEANETVTVEQRNAHGWVEYYAPGVGWVVLEATPPEGVEDTAFVPETEPTEETTEPPQTTTEPRETTEPTQTEPTGPDATEPETPEPETPMSWSFLRWLVPVAVVLLLMASVPVRYHLLRRKRRRKLTEGSTNARGISCYKELRRLSDYLSLPIPKEVTEVAEKAKFSHHELTQEELRQLYTHLGSLRQDMRALPLRKRLAAKWVWAFF